MNKMESLTNVELRGIGLKSFLNKLVVVKYKDEEDGRSYATTGILTDFNEGDEDNEGYIALSSETDYDRILLKCVNKIFLKEEDGKN